MESEKIMADDQNTAAQAAQGTPPAEGSETTQVEGQVQTQDRGQGTQTEATGENQENGEGQTSSGETGDQTGQEAKPSRVERRIQSLISKVKEVGNTQTSERPGKKGSDSYFTEEEMETGVVDPKAFEQRVQGKIQNEVQKAIQMDRVNQQYESAIRDHQSDLEGVKDIDPDLEAEAAAEYEALNYQINPLTGDRMFVPAVKFSEIVNKIQSRANKLADKKAQEIAEGNENHIRQVSSSQAVPSSGQVSGSKSAKADTTDFKEFEKTYTPRKS